MSEKNLKVVLWAIKNLHGFRYVLVEELVVSTENILHYVSQVYLSPFGLSGLMEGECCRVITV